MAREYAAFTSCVLGAPPGLDRAVQRNSKLLQADSERPTKRPQRHHVDAPFAPFAFANERLRLPQLGRQLNLRKSRAFSCLAQNLEEYSVLS